MMTARRRRRQSNDKQLSIAFVPGGLRFHLLSKFARAIDEYVYKLTLAGCSKEVGDASTDGFYCAVDLGPDVLQFMRQDAADEGDQLTTEEEDLIANSVGAITCVHDNGYVSVTYYDSRRRFDRDWEHIKEDCAEDD